MHGAGYIKNKEAPCDTKLMVETDFEYIAVIDIVCDIAISF